MAVPFHPRRLCLVDDQDRSARGRRRLALSLVRCAQPGRGTPLVYMRSGLSLAGSEDKVLALDARRCPSGLLAQTNSRLSQSIFESFSLLNTTTLLHALLLRGLAGARPAISSQKTPRYRAVMAAGCALIPRNTTARIDLAYAYIAPAASPGGNADSPEHKGGAPAK